MSDLIRRDDVLEAMSKDQWYFIKPREQIERINAIPTAEPKAGKWIEHPNHIECPNCKVWFLKKHMPRNSYCPNCGAKMERSE